MEIAVFEHVKEFLNIMQPYLLKTEIENNLMSGVCLSQLSSVYDSNNKNFYSIISEDGKPVLSSIMTPFRNLILCAGDDVSEQAFELLAAFLHENNWHVPGVIGKPELTQKFVGAWRIKTGVSGRIAMRQRIYGLREVLHPTYPEGVIRKASESERDFLLKWYDAFYEEALPGLEQIDPQEIARTNLLAGDVYLWIDKEPVCMADVGRKMINGVCVCHVYSPPETRKRGYATALVAQLSQLMLDNGFQHCCLYTDMDFPTSNHIYQQIGYKAVCDSNVYLFV